MKDKPDSNAFMLPGEQEEKHTATELTGREYAETPYSVVRDYRQKNQEQLAEHNAARAKSVEVLKR